MTDVNIQPVPPQQSSRMDTGPQQEPRMGDTPIDMSQFTRPSTSHSQLRAQLPAAPYMNREPAGAAQQHLFPVHTYVVPTNQPKQRGNYQKAALVAMRNSRPPQPFFIQRGRPENLPDEGPTVKQHLQQQQKQMKEKERMVAEQRMYTDINGGGQINVLPEGIMKNDQSPGVVKTFSVLPASPVTSVSSAPIGIAAGRSTSTVQPKRSRAANVDGAAPARSRKKNSGAGNRQLKVIVSPGVTTSFSSNSAKQQLATAPYLVQTQPLPPTTSVSSQSVVNHTTMVATSNSEDTLSKVPSTSRRNISSEMTPLGFNSAPAPHVSVSNDSAAQVMDLSLQPSNGLDLVGADPFLDTNGFDDLDINDIVPFNVGDANWTFQFDENHLFNNVGGGVETAAASGSGMSSAQRPLEQNQFAKGSISSGLPDNNYIRMEALDNTSGVCIDTLPDDFLTPQTSNKTDIIENLLKDDVIDNDPLLAQVDEKTLLNDSILNDFPEMLGGDAALRCVMNEGIDDCDDEQEMISLIDWVTNDDHKIGEDGEDFVQNLRDERLENSASEFYNVCGAVEFNSMSGFDSEAGTVESMPSTSKKSASIATVPVIRPPSLISQAHVAPNSSPTESSSKTPESTPTRQRRKQRSPKESEKERTPRVDRRRHEDRLAKQKKAEQDAIEKEKEARQQAADRERILQIMEMQQKEIEAETRAAEAQQKNGGTPGRNRNRNRSQARNRQAQRTSVSDPPSAPLLISQRLSPVQSSATSTASQPVVPAVVSQGLPSADQPVQPSVSGAQATHPLIIPAAVDVNPSVQSLSSTIQQPSPYMPTTSFTSLTPVTPLQMQNVEMSTVPAKPVRPQTAESFIVTEFSSRPPRPFSEDSGQKFYENQQPGPSSELKRAASWDGHNSSEKQRTALQQANSENPVTRDFHRIPVQQSSSAAILESPVIHQQFTPSSAYPGPPSQVPVAELWTRAEETSSVEETPEEALESLKELQAFADFQLAVFSGNEDQMKEALGKMDEEEQLNEYSELSTEALFSMLDNPRETFTKEELQMFKENFGIDTDEQVQPEDLADPDIWEVKEEVAESMIQGDQDVIRTQILVSLLLNTNDEKEEELAYMESQVAELERMSEEMYGIKLKALKNGVTSVTYANAALVDELSRLSGRLIVTNEERKLLARRLCHHQRNYIRRLQTASKRKSEAEKKKQEMLLRNPAGVFLNETPKKVSKEPKAAQDRNKNNKKKPIEEANKKVILTAEEQKPKAPSKRKRPAVKEKLEKTPRRSSLDGQSTPSRKRARALSDVPQTVHAVDVVPNSIAEQFPRLPVELAHPQLSVEKAPVEMVPSSSVPVNTDRMDVQVAHVTQKEESEPVSDIQPATNGTVQHEAVVPSTPVSSVNMSTPTSRRKSSRRSAQNLNFTEDSPRGTPDPDENAAMKRRRGRQVKTVESDSVTETPTRRKPRKVEDPASKITDETAKSFQVDSESTDDTVTDPAKQSIAEESIKAEDELSKEETPTHDQGSSAPRSPSSETLMEVPTGVATPTVESPLTSVGGSEPQDTTTSPDTPASNESEEKGGRRMRPRRQSQLRHASEMIDILNDDEDDEPVKKRRRPRNANETPKRQSTRTRRS